jgi:hypothetical protein
MPFDAEAGLTPRDRLLLVADAMTGLGENQLALGMWMNQDHSCGCALGWAIEKYGKKLELELREVPAFGGGKRVVNMPFLRGEALFSLDSLDRAWALLGAHFGINPTCAQELFGGQDVHYTHSYLRGATPQIVKERLLEVAGVVHETSDAHEVCA